MNYTCIDCKEPTPSHMYDGDERVCYFCLGKSQQYVDEHTKSFDDVLNILTENKIEYDYIENFHLYKKPIPGMKYGCVFHIYVKDNEDKTGDKE